MQHGLAVAPIRVVLQYSPTLFGIAGLYDDAACHQTVHENGQTFYRARSTPRWILYRHTVKGWGQTSDRPHARQE